MRLTVKGERIRIHRRSDRLWYWGTTTLMGSMGYRSLHAACNSVEVFMRNGWDQAR